MKMPDSVSRIIEVTHPFAAQISPQRPLYSKTLPDGLEIEIKIPIESEMQVAEVMTILEPLGMSGAEHRSENHYVFKLDDGAHICRILVDGMDGEWLKIKSKNTPIYTPKYRFPAVQRVGTKLKAADNGYKEAYKLTTEIPLMTSFNKECLNFFYPYKGCIFSLSLSLAWNDDFLRQEMEFEYEGHFELRTPPHRNEIEEMIEDMIVELVPVSLHPRIHAETKYESLSR